MLGESFTIVSDEPESVITQAIAHLEERVQRMQHAISSQDLKKVALLTALDLARDYVQSKAHLDGLLESQMRVLAHLEHEIGV